MNVVNTKIVLKEKSRWSSVSCHGRLPTVKYQGTGFLLGVGGGVNFGVDGWCLGLIHTGEVFQQISVQ